MASALKKKLSYALTANVAGNECSTYKCIEQWIWQPCELVDIVCRKRKWTLLPYYFSLVKSSLRSQSVELLFADVQNGQIWPIVGQKDCPVMGQVLEFLRSVSVHFSSPSQIIQNLSFFGGPIWQPMRCTAGLTNSWQDCAS